MKYLALFIGLLSLALSATKALALTPAATPSAATEEKVEEIRNAVKEKVKEKLDEMKLGLKRAFVGQISEISNSTIIVESIFGKHQIKVTEETKIIDQNRKGIKLADLEIGNYIMALGYLNEDKVLEAKRIVVFNKPKVAIRKVAFGKVTDISSEEKLLTVKNERKGNVFTVEVTDKTVITKKMDGSVKVAKFSDIKTGDWIVAVGTISDDEDKIIFAKLIHVIPGLSKPSPTISPKASPTKGIKPSATPTTTEE